ncbi:MAG: murein biosynthesis integral membrane protein MurJ, partial [Desulfobulbaceae bacterium]|nr:murein biosynthesis integral membrane protein MurJ [Desulfobulbaceae bacterium]
SGAMICNFLFLSVVLYKKVKGYSLSYLGTSLIKIFAASVLMGVWVRILHGWLGSLFGEGIILQITSLLVVIASAALLYGIILYVLKVKELTFVVDKVKSRIAK